MISLDFNKKVFRTAILFALFVSAGFLLFPDEADATAADGTWVVTDGFDIFESSSLTWDADGPAVCTATLTDVDAFTATCSSGSVASDTTYRVQVILKNETGSNNMSSNNGIVHRNVVWAGGDGATITNSTDCAFNDFGTDDGTITCAVSLGDDDTGGTNNDVIVTASGSGNNKMVIVGGGTEGIAYLIKTGTAVDDVTSYFIEKITSEISSKIDITGPAAAATLTQNDFEFWYDNDAADPVEVIGTPDLAENTVLNAIPVHNEAPTSTVEIRVRMNMTVGDANISADAATLKLQYATSTISSLACSSETTSNFKDVEANASTAAWKFTGSTTVADGDVITPSITGSDTGKYARTNTQGNPAANQNDDIEFDWHVQKDINANGATYCFRAVKSTGDLDAYNSDSYPRITTAPGSENILRHGNFFDQAEEKGFYWAN